MIAATVAMAPVALNSENLAISRGFDSIIVEIADWGSALLERLFDPYGAWMFWLGVGVIVGTIIHSRAKRLDEQIHGRMGGPSMFYLRAEARMIRAAIAFPLLRRISADFDGDLENLNRVLTDIHRFPPLPCISFHDAPGLERTSEYLRLILPNLDERHLTEAHASASRYVQRLNRPPPERSAAAVIAARRPHPLALMV